MAWLSKYSSNPFVRNIGVMFSGNGLALVIPFLIAPLISRIYTPEDFAGFELFVRILSLVAIVGSLRLELAILLPKEREEVLALVKLCFRILLIVTVVSSILILPFSDEIGALLKNESLPELLFLLPIGVFSLGALNIMNQYLIKSQSFKEAAIAKVTMSTSNNMSKYLIGLNFPTSFSLSIGQIIGAFLPLVIMLRLREIRDMLAETFRIKSSSRVMLKRYKEFPLVNTFHAFFNEAQYAVLLFLISAYYGEVVLGLFGFAFRYLRVPLTVFGASIGQVLNEKWSRDLNEEKSIGSAVIRTLIVLFGIGILPFGVLFFFGEPIFSFVFGEEWALAGRYAEVISPWLFLNFIVSPISSLPILLKRQGTFFVMAVVGNLVTLFLVFFAGHGQWNFTSLLWLMVISNSALMLVSIIWLIRVSGIGRKDINQLT
jgi:O-antigen/teichoic acid export membrane protein